MIDIKNKLTENKPEQLNKSRSVSNGMNLAEIQKVARNNYSPIFALEDTLSHRFRKPFAKVLLIITVFLLLSAGVLLLYGTSNFLHLNNLIPLIVKLFGGGLITLSLWFVFFASNAFFYSYYFKRPEETKGLFIDFDLAYSVSRLNKQDITGSFFSLLLGSRFLLRTGVKVATMADFLSK